MGETRVDLQHLLEDLRDAYVGSLEESILTEIVANALDSGAGRVAFLTDRSQAVVVAVDDGRGMTRRELARYHDVAASGKARGEGIGFAGVGIKLGLLACEEVLTETLRGDKRIATRWRLTSRNRAPWHWVDPPGFVEGHGTGVCLKLKNPLSPLLDGAWLEGVLREHFQPLLDPAFAEALFGHYPHGVSFRIDGRVLAPQLESWERSAIRIMLARKRKPAGLGLLHRSPDPLPVASRGVAVSTLGKVIRRGWDWLGLTPTAPEHVGGLIEIPALAESLTLNKADFLRSGPRGIAYLAYRKAIQQAVATQLAAWGEGPSQEDSARQRAARPLERDLESVLVRLADDFPALAPLVERHAGGQRRLPTGGGSGLLAQRVGSRSGIAAAGEAAGDVGVSGDAATASEGECATHETQQGPDKAGASPSVSAGGGPRRPGHYRLRVQFEKRTDSQDLGRLVESAVLVNTAHPAYLRALASRSEGYHIALTAGMALAALAAEPAKTQEFLSVFMARWGEALTRDGRRH